ncbi:MAG: hypothetical protein ACD_14C00048G0002 [uncultured bacterium]|nr:MAG: hypothetical protein ACD_14C00048G0002 [uncultured bacterium]
MLRIFVLFSVIILGGCIVVPSHHPTSAEYVSVGARYPGRYATTTYWADGEYFHDGDRYYQPTEILYPARNYVPTPFEVILGPGALQRDGVNSNMSRGRGHYNDNRHSVDRGKNHGGRNYRNEDGRKRR